MKSVFLRVAANSCGLLMFAALSLTSLASGKLTSLSAQQAIEKSINQALIEFKIPGAGIAVIKKGEPVLVKGFGVASIETKQLVNQQTLFKIASNSKAFTAASLAILVDQGKLNWSDKVVNYLPNFKLYDAKVTQAFNIIDLLTHRSGLRKGAGDLMIWPEPTKFTRQDIINNLGYLKPVSEFRKAYAYDNLLYIVAGEIVAKISGMSWEQFVEKHIFSVLNMRRCFAGGVPQNHNNNSVAAHTTVGGKLKVLKKNAINNTTSIMAAAGGIKCSVNDLAKWVAMLLENGSTQSLLSSRQKTALWQPVTPLNLSSSMENFDHSTFHSYALGWRISDYFGHKRVSHTGMLGGSMSQIVLFPELELGVVVLTNQQSGLGRNAIVRSLLQHYIFPEMSQPIDWVDKYAAIKKSRENQANNKLSQRKVYANRTKRVANNSQQKQLSARLGSYKDPWFGKITLSQVDGDIIFKSEMSPRLVGKVFWHSENQWWVKWDDRSFEADAWLIFHPRNSSTDSKANLVKHLTMTPISSSTDFSFDFEDLSFTQLNESPNE